MHRTPWLPVAFLLSSAAILATMPARLLGAWPNVAQSTLPPSREMVWVLGGKLAMAAVLYESGAADDLVAPRFRDAEAIGKALGVLVPALPAKSGTKSKDSAAILHYVLVDAGQPMMKLLDQKYDPSHARLFELATRSTLLLMLYTPGESTGMTIAGVIERDGPLAKLPEQLWRPLSEKIRRRAAFNDVRDAVSEMQDAVTKYLAGEPRPPAGR